MKNAYILAPSAVQLIAFKSKIKLFLLSIFISATTVADPTLNGVAIHSELGQQQFIAGLFSENSAESASSILTSTEPKRMEVRVLAKRLSSRRFKRMWIEGVAINSSDQEMQQYASYLANFSNLLKMRMVAGDIFTIDRTLENVSVSINGTLLGELDDPTFFDLLLRTWLGSVPLSSEFRSLLLVGRDINSQLRTQFQNTGPTEERITSVKSAVNARNEQEAAGGSRIQNPSGDAIAIGIDTAIGETRVAISAPTIEAPTLNTPTTADDTEGESASITTPITTPTTTPEPTPTPVIALAPQQAELDDSIFFEDDDSEEFTAEGLLEEQLYYKRLARYTHQFLRYPQRAWERGREGNIRLRVTIDRDGKVQNTEILDAAKYKSLNREAKNAVGRADPYPPIPDSINISEYSFTFRVSFKVVQP